jgi:hypothetical protein
MRLAPWLLAATACGAAPPGLVGPDTPVALRPSCQLAELRCSRCHSLDRVLVARVETPQHWVSYVERMRRQPSSGISPKEARSIVRCLVARSFGEAAVPE